MGGSLALALRDKCNSLFGIDADPDAVDYAKTKRIFDRVSSRSEGILNAADMIVLSAPVCSIIEILEELPDYVLSSAIVIDLGSTKTSIVQKMNNLPDRFVAIGGHPICGKEVSSFVNSSPEIFKDAPFALIPTARTTQQGRQIAMDLAVSIGSRPLWIAAELHDRYVAATSHLPYLVSSALAVATPEEALVLAGTGLQSTTRLAGSSVDVMLDILDTNKENILKQLQEFRGSIDQIIDFLTSDEVKQLRRILEEGRELSCKIKSTEKKDDNFFG